jgi:lipopolysaccharide biosynthesis glycosyltransferase
MINIWIGYDQQFDMNTGPQVKSILANTVSECNIKFLKLDDIKNQLTRQQDPNQTNDTAFTRWIIPHLTNYTGWHLYMDGDMMVRKDIQSLWDLRDESKAVMVVKHSDVHDQSPKYNGHKQLHYLKKNWSSLMLINAELCKALTIDYINTAPGLDLHQFNWIDDSLIGSLPNEWNYLVGVNDQMVDPANVHWTLFGPWVGNTEFSNEWASYNVA